MTTRSPTAALVTSTLEPATAAAMPWQAVVIGAGPAGSSAAIRLAAAGVRTLLVDRQALPRGKVCGCCLSTAAVVELRGLAATPAAAELAALPSGPLETVRLLHRGRDVVLPFPGGAAVSRETLDATLVRGAIASGCDWLPGCEVTAVEETGRAGGPVTVVVAASRARGPCVLRADHVVIATGLADRVRVPGGGEDRRVVEPGSRIGLGAVLPSGAVDLPPGRLVMAIGRAGYCGLVRLEDGRIDLAAAVDRMLLTRHGDPREAIVAVVADATGDEMDVEPLAAAVRQAGVAATPPLTRSAGVVAGRSGRILRVGDAAAYVEPFTGEGIGWALAGGRMAAEAIVSQEFGAGIAPDAPTAAVRYREAHRRWFAACHRRCRCVAGVVRRPAAVAAALGMARIVPGIAGRVLPAVVGVGGRLR